MLLTAMLDGSRVDATTYRKEAWSELQESEDRKRMVMPVCGVRAVAKTRGGTTKFFAHLRKAGCKVDHGGETPQHLAMKEALKLCIDQVPGWHAIVEHPHRSRDWIIDVLAESDDLTRKVAFEVQLSSQTPDKYFARSQRYFDSSIFPVWLVPRRLEYHETKVPIVVTGFGKSSTLPESVTDLLALPADQDFVQAKNNLGVFVAALLRQGPRWRAGSPKHQAALQKAAADREAARAEAERKKVEAIEQAIAEMNDRSASPEAAFGQHLIRTPTDTFVWGSLTSCWSCEQPMLVWDARIWARGKYAGAPGLRVKPDVGEAVGEPPRGTPRRRQVDPRCQVRHSQGNYPEEAHQSQWPALRRIRLPRLRQHHGSVLHLLHSAREMVAPQQPPHGAVDGAISGHVLGCED
ncbi:MAG: competence protein CoiA family protein [Arthrobacter sp.]